jgi:hypothetical protein
MKSGWCSSICPLLPVQRLYGQTPFMLVRNSHCAGCVSHLRLPIPHSMITSGMSVAPALLSNEG